MAKLTDAEIVAALLANPTNQAAADALGVSIRHLYTRMEKPAFKRLYKTAQENIMSDVVDLVRRNLSKAVETIAEIMCSAEVAPQTRINAAEMLLRNSSKLQASATEEAWENALGGPPLWR